MSLALTLHVLSTIIWVGGMFFAHMALRPAVNALLEPPQRLPLMLKVLDAFFLWVWISVILLLTSGYWMLFFVYGESAPASQWLMAIVGTLMAAIFVFIYTVPHRKMSRALAENLFPKAGEAMALIRRLIGVNLSLGLFVSVVAVFGKYSGF
jgi:uncharacterized membrane protein